MSKTDAPEPADLASPAAEAYPPPGASAPAEAAKAGKAETEAERAELAASVEVVIFASDKPMPAAKASEVAAVGGQRNVRRAVADLNAAYEQSGRSFRIVEIAGGYQFQTLPEYGDVLGRLRRSRSDSRLSQAAMETLAIVAYRQPVLRADIEAIRGVACGEVLRGLMEKNLLRIAGRAEEIGRPILYGSTRQFLEVFGLANIEDLPNAEQLRMPLGQEVKAEESDDVAEAEEADDETTPGPEAAASDEEDVDDELDDDDEFDDDEDEFDDDDDELDDEEDED